MTRVQGRPRPPQVGDDRSVRRLDADQPHRPRQARALRAERRRRGQHRRLQARTATGLTPLAGSTQPLGAGSVRPGAGLVHARRHGARRDREDLEHDRRLSASTATAWPARRTSRPRPAARRSASTSAARHLLVSEAAGSASSYDVSRGGRERDQRRGRDAPGRTVLAVIATVDGRYAYTANAGSRHASPASRSPRRRADAARRERRHRQPRRGQPPARRDGHAATASYLYNLTDGLNRITGFRINDERQPSPGRPASPACRSARPGSPLPSSPREPAALAGGRLLVVDSRDQGVLLGEGWEGLRPERERRQEWPADAGLRCWRWPCWPVSLP